MRRSIKYGLYGAVLAGVLGGTLAWTTVDKSVTLQVDGQSQLVHTVASNVGGALSDAGLKVGAHDLVAPSAQASIHDGSTIVLKRGRLLHLSIDGVNRDIWVTDPSVSQAMADLGFPTTAFTSVSRDKRLPLTPTAIDIRSSKTISLDNGGTTQTVTTSDETVGALLSDLGIVLSGSDTVVPAADAKLVDGATVTVARVTNGQITQVQPIPFPTTQKPDPSLPTGQTKILTAGKDGSQQVVYAVVYVNGVASGQTVLSTTVLSPPTPQVVGVGSATVAAAQSAQVVTNVTPGSAQAIAQQMLAARGWGSDQFSCLVQMWNRESGWRVNAANSSGAYGIPQALPGSKMSSAGADWQTNPATQIAWGLGYIAGRYSTPCGAWSFWQAHNYY